MKKALRAALFCLTVLGAASAFAAPEVLIVQVMRGETPEESVELAMASELAGELSKEGRVAPIVWAMSDPVYRLSVEEGIIPRYRANPTDAQINETAQKLKVKYVLTVQAYKFEGILFSRAYLYQVGRSRAIWEFTPENQASVNSFVVLVNGIEDWEATSKSLASTWSAQLNVGPFKEFAARNPAVTLDPNTGIGNLTPGGIEIAASAGKEALERAKELIEMGRTDLGVLYLRDSIDANPYEASRRQMLVELLLDLGLVTEAADEAQRAAELTGSGPDMWLLTARCWISAQQPERADAAIKEALARGGQGGNSKRILGQIRLLEGNPEEAVKLLSESISEEETFEAYLARALAYALMGNEQALTQDLQQLELSTKPLTVRQYVYCIGMIGERGQVLAKRLANLPTQVSGSGFSDASLAVAESLEEEAAALSAFLTKIQAPKVHEKSHATRDLAHKLLLQSAQEALAFARGVDPDASMESALSLGEAIQLFKAVEAQIAAERQG